MAPAKSGESPGSLPPESPRYTSRPLPPYRHLPGATPHPEKDPRGHMYAQPEPAGASLSPHQWKASEVYLYGADLFNHGYWWEAHAVWEILWRGARGDPILQTYLRGLIQASAALVKWRAGRQAGARKLLEKAGENLQRVAGECLEKRYSGLEVRAFAERLLLLGRGDLELDERFLRIELA